MCRGRFRSVGVQGDGRGEPKTQIVPPVVLEDGDGLDAYRVDQHTPDLALAAGEAALVVMRGPSAGSWFVLDGRRVELGRDAPDIPLPDHTVSRRHASIERIEGDFWIEDLGSLNGLYLNDALVERTILHDGDRLQVGLFKLVFFAPRA